MYSLICLSVSSLFVSQDLHGRQFLSVLDLEDQMQHQDLQASLIPGTQDVPSIPSSPTSAQLHVLATSVICGVSPATDPQPSFTIPEDILNPSTHPGLYMSIYKVLYSVCTLNKFKPVVNSIVNIWTQYVLYFLDILEETPSLGYIEPKWDPERVAPPNIVDPFDSEICQSVKIPSTEFNSAPYTPPTVWFSSRLSELDVQLAVLQNIADHLEKDFTNSRMVHMHFVFLFSLLPKFTNGLVKLTCICR